MMFRLLDSLLKGLMVLLRIRDRPMLVSPLVTLKTRQLRVHKAEVLGIEGLTSQVLPLTAATSRHFVCSSDLASLPAQSVLYLPCRTSNSGYSAS